MLRGVVVSWFRSFLVSNLLGFVVSEFLGFLLFWFLGCKVSWGRSLLFSKCPGFLVSKFLGFTVSEVHHGSISCFLDDIDPISKMIKMLGRSVGFSGPAVVFHKFMEIIVFKPGFFSWPL